MKDLFLKKIDFPFKKLIDSKPSTTLSSSESHTLSTATGFVVKQSEFVNRLRVRVLSNFKSSSQSLWSCWLWISWKALRGKFVTHLSAYGVWHESATCWVTSREEGEECASVWKVEDSAPEREMATKMNHHARLVDAGKSHWTLDAMKIF